MTEYRVRKSLRVLSLCAALAAFGACSDSTGPGDRLQPEDVAAIYSVCELSFVPTGGLLPSVSLLVTSFEFGEDVSKNPTIGLDPNAQRTLELTYVPKGSINDQEIHGTYNLRGSSTVEIRFNRNQVDPNQFLIPDNRVLSFEFQESPLQLTMAASEQYNVTRDVYVTLSGVDPAGLANQIPGALKARFIQGGCPA